MRKNQNYKKLSEEFVSVSIMVMMPLGLTLVVTPLLSLMEDQLFALQVLS